MPVKQETINKNENLYNELKDKYFFYCGNLYETTGMTKTLLKVNKIKTEWDSYDIGYDHVNESNMISIYSFNYLETVKTQFKFSEISCIYNFLKTNIINKNEFIDKRTFYKQQTCGIEMFITLNYNETYNKVHFEKMMTLFDTFKNLRYCKYVIEKDLPNNYPHPCHTESKIKIYYDNFIKIGKKQIKEYITDDKNMNQFDVYIHILNCFDKFKIINPNQGRELQDCEEIYKFLMIDEDELFNIKCPICRTVNTVNNKFVPLKGLTEECCICMNQMVSQILPNCGHCCICTECGDKIKTKL